MDIDPAVIAKLKGEIAAAANRRAVAQIDAQRFTDAATEAQARADAEDATVQIGRSFAVQLGLDPDNL